MKVVFTTQAKADLFAQLDWLEALSPKAARRATDVVHAKLAILASFPLDGPKVDGIHRHAMVRFGQDGFVIRYRVEGDLIIILRLFHGRRDR